MIEASLSPKQLAGEVDVVYETIRGILKGDRPPSKLLLHQICRVLRLDCAAMHEMLVTEQMKRRFNRVPALKKNDPGLQSIEDAWPLLLPHEKEHVLLLIGKYAEQNQRQKFDAPAPRIVP